MISILNTTLFFDEFYLQVSSSKTYLPLVKDAIKTDVSAQSSYVGIPEGILLEGLDDQNLQSKLDTYMISITDYMNFKTTKTHTDYPADSFITPLTEFLEADAAANGYTASKEQYALLDAVANDTAQIVEKHIDIFQLDLFKGASAFNKLHHQIYNISQQGLYVLWIWLALMLCLFLLHYNQLYTWLLYQFTSFWIVGGIITIPILVLKGFNLVKRLAIDTPYLKYVVDMLLSDFINRFLHLGLLFFLLSSMGLILYTYRTPSKFSIK